MSSQSFSSCKKHTTVSLAKPGGDICDFDFDVDECPKNFDSFDKREQESAFDCQTNSTMNADWAEVTPSVADACDLYRPDGSLYMPRATVDLPLVLSTRLSTIEDMDMEDGSEPMENEIRESAYIAAVQASQETFLAAMTQYNEVPMEAQYGMENYYGMDSYYYVENYYGMENYGMKNYDGKKNVAPTVAPKKMKMKGYQEKKKQGEQSQGKTTFMIRNIPNRYTREMLREELRELGYGYAFDFLYVPIDFAHERNYGYAFINLFDDIDAKKFVAKLTGRHFRREQSKKVAEVVPALLQGKIPNANRYRHNGVMNMPEQFHPQFFDRNGNIVGFPFE